MSGIRLSTSARAMPAPLAIACPRCRQSWSEGPLCPSCGQPSGEIALHDPGHFVVMGIFLGGFVPMWMAARNYRRLGRAGLANTLVWSGVAVTALVGTLATMVPDGIAVAIRPLGLAMSLTAGFGLRSVQRPLYLSWRRRGGGHAPSAGQMFLGLAVSAGVLLVTIVVMAVATA